MIFSDHRIGDLTSKYLPRASFEAGGGEKYFGAVLQAVEIVGVAGAMTYMNNSRGAAGRGAIEFMGVPADLALGLIFTGLGVTGYFGEHGKHSLNVGCGFLGAYACRMGQVWGVAAKHEALSQSGVVRGAFGQGMPGGQEFPVQQAPVSAPYPWAA